MQHFWLKKNKLCCADWAQKKPTSDNCQWLRKCPRHNDIRPEANFRSKILSWKVGIARDNYIFWRKRCPCFPPIVPPNFCFTKISPAFLCKLEKAGILKLLTESFNYQDFSSYYFLPVVMWDQSLKKAILNSAVRNIKFLPKHGSLLRRSDLSHN